MDAAANATFRGAAVNKRDRTGMASGGLAAGLFSVVDRGSGA
jgi:hypothetical protein